MLLSKFKTLGAHTRRRALKAVSALRLMPWAAMLAVVPTLAPAASVDATKGWYPFVIEPRLAAAQQPAAFPPRPALDASDRVTVVGRHFMRAGPDRQVYTADDSRVRFFGVNLSFDANLPDAAGARELARTLAAAGVNAVRLHHLDTRPTPQHLKPRGVLSDGPYPSFHPEGISRVRGLIQEFSRHGIYVNLNLRVAYVFRPEVDDIPGFDAKSMSRPGATPIGIYHPILVERQRQYAAALIQALDLRHQPVLAMVEISNEASLLAAWYRKEWQDAVPPAYEPELEQRWQAWLVQEYGSIEAACTAWGSCRRPKGPVYLLTPSDLEHATGPLKFWLQRATQQGRQWLHQQWDVRLPEASLPVEEPRTRDFLRFLAAVDAGYFEQMRATVQASAGFDVPVTGTQMGYGGPLNHLAMREMDYLDDHFYIDHPHFPQGHRGQSNWRVWNPSLRTQEQDLLLRHALRREWSKPFVVSEYNQPYPSLYGGEILPMFTSLAVQQDWDGIFFFEYTSSTEPAAAPANFGLEGDWGKWVQLAQAARLFHSASPGTRESRPPARAQSPARTLTLNLDEQISLTHRGRLSDLEELARQKAGLQAADVWRSRIGVASSEDIDSEALYSGPDSAVQFQEQRWTLQTDDHLIYAGEPVHLPSGLPLAYHAPAGTPPFTLWLNRLAALPPKAGSPAEPGSQASSTRELAGAQRWLLTLGSTTVGSQPGASPARPKRLVPHPLGQSSWTLEPDAMANQVPSAPRHAHPPAWLPTAPLQVQWQAPATVENLRIFPLDEQGKRGAALPTQRIQRQGATFILSLQQTAEETSPWYELVAEDAPEK